MRVLLAFLTLLPPSLTGCDDCPSGQTWHAGLEQCVVNDTCSGGDNMTNPRLADPRLADNNAGHAVLRVIWDVGTGRGAELPRSYFAAVVVEDPPPIVLAATSEGDRQLAIELNQPAAAAAAAPTTVVLRFPDRRQYIACAHPAMADKYYLDVSFVLPGDGTIGSPTLKQRVNYGDF